MFQRLPIPSHFQWQFFLSFWGPVLDKGQCEFVPNKQWSHVVSYVDVATPLTSDEFYRYVEGVKNSDGFVALE